jgi:tRNA uridine 5-carbamoylmethylation protein Kti12
MVNIQFFGGPGAGKSTAAAGLFYKMKTEGYKVEYITEYAKELVFAEEHIRLKDQLHILGEQHHRLKRLEGKVDYVIHDSPFLLGLMYLKEDEHLPKDTFKQLVTEMYKSYENINIFLERNLEVPYQEYGREQKLEGSIEIDDKIKHLLQDYNIPFISVKSHNDTVNNIYKCIKV